MIQALKEKHLNRTFATRGGYFITFFPLTFLYGEISVVSFHRITSTVFWLDVFILNLEPKEKTNSQNPQSS